MEGRNVLLTTRRKYGPSAIAASAVEAHVMIETHTSGSDPLNTGDRNGATDHLPGMEAQIPRDFGSWKKTMPTFGHQTFPYGAFCTCP